MNRAVKQQGFTLIELMLAMAFISVLLLAIAMTIIQVGTIYNRGMTLKEVNQSARSISDDLKRSLSASEAFSLSTKYVTTTGGGRLCLGQNSYIWNLGKAIDQSDTNLTKYDQSSVKKDVKIRFIKVPDSAGLYCLKNAGGLVNKNIRAVDTTLTTDLLKEGDRILTLHQLTITSGVNASDSATGQQLYNIIFTIGTGKTSALTSDQTSCLPPSDPNSDFAYCTVQQFTLAVRAGDRVN